MSYGLWEFLFYIFCVTRQPDIFKPDRGRHIEKCLFFVLIWLCNLFLFGNVLASNNISLHIN